MAVRLWRQARLTRRSARIGAPFATAALLAIVFAACLSGRGEAEGRARMIASAALGPSGAAAPYAPPVASLERLAGVPFRSGVSVDEGLRLAFEACDHSDVFRGAPVTEASCRAAPNEVAALIRLEGGAIFMEATLGLDLSGSHAACAGRPSPGCAPFFDFEDAPGAAYDDLGARWGELFVASDVTPLVTLPLDATPHGRAFVEATGVSIGDVGVVIYRDRLTPVMVSNGGPSHRALSGSLGLFDAIGVSRCRRRVAEAPEFCAEAKPYGLGAPVVVILFPGSRLEGLTPETAEARVALEARRRFEALRRGPVDD